MYSLAVTIIVYTGISMSSPVSATSYVVDGFTSREACETAMIQAQSNAPKGYSSKAITNCFKKEQ